MLCYDDNTYLFRSHEKNDFTVSINVAGGGALSFNLTFEELLKRKDGYFENSISISPGQVSSYKGRLGP